MSQTGTSQSNSLKRAASCSEQAPESESDPVHSESMSKYKYSGHGNSESHAQSTCILEPLLGEDKESPAVLESKLYTTDPLSPPFDALEFSTSPLPPSSPLPSSTTYGSLLSLRQVSHGVEQTLMGFDEIPLPSTMSDSCEVGSSSGNSGSRHVTPDSDLASASPLRYLPRSGLSHKVPTPLASNSKADLIPDLLACDDPWNVIGNMLDLPPIPAADATYFDSIRTPHTGLLHERVSSSVPSSSLGQVGIREPSCTVRNEGTRLREVHSDGDLLNCPDPWCLRVGYSHKTSRRATSLLLSRESPNKALSPARPFRSIRETRPPRSAQSHSPSSSATSGDSPVSPVLSEASQPLLKPQAPQAPPGPLRSISGTDLENFSAPVKTLSPPPSILTPQRSTPPSPKNSNSRKKSVSRSPGISQWNATTESDAVGLMPKVSPTKPPASKAQVPKLEFPDLFQDEDGFGGVF